jgi:hypothetical protein
VIRAGKRLAKRRGELTLLLSNKGLCNPEVWVADRYAAQTGHAHERQLYLAHLLRDAQYAIDSGDTGFAAGFYKLLQRAVGMGHRRAKLKDTTLAQYAPISTAGSTGCSRLRPTPRPDGSRQPGGGLGRDLGSGQGRGTGGNGWCFRRPPSIN